MSMMARLFLPSTASFAQVVIISRSVRREKKKES